MTTQRTKEKNARNLAKLHKRRPSGGQCRADGCLSPVRKGGGSHVYCNLHGKAHYLVGNANGYLPTEEDISRFYGSIEKVLDANQTLKAYRLVDQWLTEWYDLVAHHGETNERHIIIHAPALRIGICSMQRGIDASQLIRTGAAVVRYSWLTQRCADEPDQLLRTISYALVRQAGPWHTTTGSDQVHTMADRRKFTQLIDWLMPVWVRVAAASREFERQHRENQEHLREAWAVPTLSTSTTPPSENQQQGDTHGTYEESP